MLSKKQSYVRSIDIANELNFSKPSVSRAMSILKKEGYVTAAEDGCLSLTEKGLQEAESMYIRHTVLTKLLVGLGVDEETAAEDACRIEHVISEKSFAAMQAHMEQMAKEATT